MRLTFVTSCLEPGRDGVGDYTRLLAQECSWQGHPCCLIALNDPFVREPLRGCESTLPVLRLPAGMDWRQRSVEVRRFLDAFEPDWLSFQFVPYSYNSRGIVFGLARQLQPLVDGRRLHLMLHELWLAQHRSANLKERLIGSIQRLYLLALVEELKPTVTHTSNPAYLASLIQSGVSAGCLPIFGNIPIVKTNETWLFTELHTHGLHIDKSKREGFWLFGLFGSLHPAWPPEPLFSRLYEGANQSGKKIVILSIGRLGYGEGLWKELVNRYGSRFTFVRLGEQSPERISEFFHSIDFGIATPPYQLLGKSATVVAMLEHGLPVIVNRDDIHVSACRDTNLYSEELLYKMDNDLPGYLARGGHRSPARSRLPEIAGQLLAELQAVSPVPVPTR
ncbi:MAG: glycosyltransferase [Gemmatimonadaceae bacterium]|nr:glycosyltransferase [Gloeobacterales cyanobacterium ES-bin-141]